VPPARHNARVRRIVPWALLVVVLVGTGVGAVVGQTNAPSAPRPTPAQWIDGVLATTRAAGSAHFGYSHVTTSPNPALRSTLTGNGVVDFATRSVRVSEVDQQVEVTGGPLRPHDAAQQIAMETIAIGASSWQRFLGGWVKDPQLPDLDDPLSLQRAGNASVALAGIAGPEPVVSVRTLGPAALGGVATTRYLVTTAPPRPCAAQQAAAVSGDALGPTMLWVDGRGRLVRASVTMRTDFRLPLSLQHNSPADLPTGFVVTTATLHLVDFGARVEISAPVVRPEPYRSSTGFAVSRSCNS
jgi:hypothetical protein